MIVIDENSQLIDWLKSHNSEGIGFVRVDLTTFELSQGLESELVMIQDTLYHQLTDPQKAKLQGVEALLVFQSSKAPLQFYLSNVIGVVTPETSEELLTNQILYLEDKVKGTNILKSQLITLSHELSDIMGGVENQLMRVKKAYEQRAPKRLENFKGLNVYSKYAAGENMGGEFFDIFARDHKIFMLMSNSSSYLASSSILQHFSELKTVTEIEADAQRVLIENIKAEIDNLNRSKKKTIITQLLTFELDLNEMELTGYQLGEFEVVSSNEEHDLAISSYFEQDLDRARFQIKLQRGERLLFNSPGFVRTWSALSKKPLLSDMVSNTEVKALDVLDEAFFQLKKTSSSGFLSQDASSIILEVQENVILKV
ncbi:MAG: hypothetical protein CME62_01155 [Halobacteriovoraceae bacterium]|nr:hypothetical protein [Halobacteriovoraceae bacterium]